MFGDFDDRRITLGRGFSRVYQGEGVCAFADGSRSISTDPRMAVGALTADPARPPSALARYIGVPPGTKYCACCGYIVPLYEYRPEPDTFDGLAPWCRGCERREEKRAIKRVSEQVALLPDGGAVAAPEPGAAVVAVPVAVGEAARPAVVASVPTVADGERLSKSARKANKALRDRRKSHFVRAFAPHSSPR